MFRKSVFIMLFLCLLATVSSAVNMPVNFWDYQLEWKGGTDADWANPGNWTPENLAGIPPATGPEPNNRCAVLPNQPGPRITGNATCLMLELNPWDPTSWGAQDVNLTITATAADVNFGSCVCINSEVSYDSYLGTSYLASRAIVNVYGGTVATPGPYMNQTGMCGISVGGGSDNYGLSYGMLNIYGGLVSVPKAALFFGEIGLYGGTLQVTGDPNFTISSTHPLAALNKVRIDGGTLILAGNHATDINTFRTGGFVVCDRGTLRDPVYDGSAWTTLVADINYCTWNPSPANGAINVHYYTSDGNSITLSWNPSTLVDIDVNHDVYFGTSFADVNTATKTSTGIYKGSLSDPYDPCSYVVKDPNKFSPNTTYYWRVDEYSNSGSNFEKGLIWSFTTTDGRASVPTPVDDVNAGNALSEPLQLSWTAGDWTSPNGHRVYFGTSYTSILNASTSNNDGRYRGTVTNPVYPLSRLMETGAVAPGKSWVLTPGTPYFWRIDEMNGATQVGGKGAVWGFTPAAYFNIDDFETYSSTDDVNLAWPNHYAVTGCIGSFGDSGRILVRDSTGKYMRFSYYGNTPSGMNFSEAKRPYTCTSFTGKGFYSPSPKALRVDYRGYSVNSADPVYDRMYVAIEDTAGNVAVYDNPDPNAQLNGNWTSWYTALKDISALGSPAPVDLNVISGFAIGFGVRCNNYDAEAGDGNVMFDNIRLYAATCVPSYAQAQGLSADLDGDCDVDINDLDILANNWLYTAVPQHSITTTVPHKAPVIWYKFNDGAGITATDSGPGSYTADVCGVAVWEPTGGRNGAGCINFNTLASQNTHVEVPPAAFDFMADADHYYNSDNGGSVSFSVWINADSSVGDTMNNSWAALFTVYDSSWNELAVFSAPIRWYDSRTWFGQSPVGLPGATAYGPTIQPSYFGGQWNHWAAVKSEPNTLVVYCNGNVVVSATSESANVPFFKLPIQSFRIGMRGGQYANWAKWSGKMQDFKVYDYALDANEVGYDATDGTSVVEFMPLISPANINTDGSASPLTDPNQKVNFGDIAIMGKQWHTQILWP
jgi:Concanavalin A-like lectin/glucanases superfamily